MNRHYIALALASAPFLLAAETRLVAQGPAYIGAIEADVNGRRVSLERQTATMDSHVRALGFGGASVYWKVAGVRSPVRFHSSDTLSFVARVASQDVDPNSLFTLSSVQPHKDQRRLPVGSSSFIPGIHERGSKFVVPLSFQPFQRNFVKMQPTAPLPAGEYMFSDGSGQTVFLFGVD